MKYIVNGAIITNRLLFTDGHIVEDIMGGCGMYAYSAVRLCTPDSMLIAGVGKDFDTYYGEWFERNHCCRDGLLETVEKTNYNELKYYPDGTYIEYSIYGPEYERQNFYKTMFDATVFKPFIHDTKGLYTTAIIDDAFSDTLLELKRDHPFRVMWEIPESAVDQLGVLYKKEGLTGVLKHLRAVDLFSLNRAESFRIFGVQDIPSAISILQGLNMPVYYRVGGKGAYVVYKDFVYHVPMLSAVAPELEIDPTGCGNSSTAAFMWAYCEDYSLEMCCAIGNAMAAYNVQQYGPYPDMTPEAFAGMLKVAEEYLSRNK